MNDKRIDFTVTMKLTKPQALAMKAFFEIWNECAIMGRSRYVAFYVDGDGDFKPNCQVTCPSLDIELTGDMRKVANTGKQTAEYSIDFDPIAWMVKED